MLGATYKVSLFDVSDRIDFTRRHKPDFLIMIYMGILMMLGLVVIYAIGPQRANVLNSAYGSNYSETYFFIKQIISMLLSMVAFAAAALIPYALQSKYAGKTVLISLGACALLAVAGWANLGIAQKTLGATRWFNLGIFGSLQPSEMLKFAVLIFSAGLLGYRSRQGKVNDMQQTIIPLAILLAVALLFIVVIQKDLGTGVSLIGIASAMLFVSGINKKNGLKIAAAILAAGSIFIISAPHRVERVLTFLKGDNTSSSTSDSSSYHIEQAKLAIGSGGLFGVGIGNSVQATGYLPEAINDSVFAIMGETFGFVGSVIILIIFIAMLIRLLKIMDHLPDPNMKLFIAGVFGWFGAHVILNIASMLGVFPLTGITLPLLSFGGTSMLFIAAALGVVFQLSHYTVFSSNLKEASYESSSSRGRVGRTRYARRSSFTRS